MQALTLNRHGLLYATSDDLAAAYGPLLKAQVDTDLSPVMDRAMEKIAQVNAGTKFTNAGKREEVARIAREAMGEITALTPRRRQMLESHLSKLDLPTRLPNFRELAERRQVEPGVLYQQLRELREHVKNLNSVEREPFLMNAAQEDDVDVLVAVSDVHPLLRPVGAPTLGKVTEAWLEGKRSPEAKTLLGAMSLYDSNARSAIVGLAKAAEIAPPKDMISGAGGGH